jgi:hypothetical protein
MSPSIRAPIISRPLPFGRKFILASLTAAALVTIPIIPSRAGSATASLQLADAATRVGGAPTALAPAALASTPARQ